jgi:hypothetical protein
MTNRLPQPTGGDAIKKIVVVHTPMGILQVALPDLPPVEGEDPLKVAMDQFQHAVDSGAEDPLQATLLKLKVMADAGESQPLTVGLAILKQMSDNGMLPPMETLIEGTGITPADVKKTLATPDTRHDSIFDKLDKRHLN